MASMMLLAAIAGCSPHGGGGNGGEEGKMDEQKVEADVNKDSLRVFMTFDEDSDEFYARNAADTETRYLVENFRNDVSGNRYYSEAKAAYRPNGVSGKSLCFDGYSNFIECGNPLKGAQEFSINLWMAIRAYDFVDSTRNITPLVEYYDATAKTGLIFGYTYHGRWGVRLSTANGEWQEIWADDCLDLYSWYNLGLVYSNGTLKLYQNGEEAKSGTCQFSSFSENAKLRIGCNTYAQNADAVFPYNYFSGLLDEVKVYDKAISAQDVKEQANLYMESGDVPALNYKDMNYPYDYLSDGNYRTSWHGAPPINWVSDINGGFYYKGKYHIFYTKSDLGPQLGGVAWGHMVSDDMIGWKETKPAIWSEDNGIDNRWVFAGSGGVVNDVPYIFYTGYILNQYGSFTCTVSMATPKDLNDPELTDWEKMSEVQLRLPDGYDTQNYRDPQIYIEGDTVYLMIVSRTNSGNPCIVAWSANVDNMTEWTWRGTVYEANYGAFKDSGYMWEVPVFLKLTSPDQSLTKWVLGFAPMGTDSNDTIYFMGEFNAETCRFVPDKTEVKRFDQGEDYFMCAPGEIYDPVSGNTVVFELIQCCWNMTGHSQYLHAYSGVLSMGRVYGIDNDGNLTVKPIDGYDKLHGDLLLSIEGKTAGETEKVYQTGMSYHANMIIETSFEENKMGFEIMSNKSGTEAITFYYDCKKQEFYLSSFKTSNLSRTISTYPYELSPLQPIVIDIYVDKSTIEIFINGEFAMSARVFNNLFCDNLVFLGDEWYIHEMTVYKMNSIWN